MSNPKQEISFQSGYVLVQRPAGYEVSISEVPAMLTEIDSACKESGCSKALILGPNTKVNLPADSIFELGKKIAEMGLQLAFVESHDASDKDVQLFKNVAQNRGGAIQFFDNISDAKDWLCFE